MNESLVYFGDGRNNVAFFNGKIPHQTPIKRVVFSDCSSFTTATIKTVCHPSRPTDFFTTQILGDHVTSRDQGLSSNDQGRKRRERLGTRLLGNLCPSIIYSIPCDRIVSSYFPQKQLGGGLPSEALFITIKSFGRQIHLLNF